MSNVFNILDYGAVAGGKYALLQIVACELQGIAVCFQQDAFQYGKCASGADSAGSDINSFLQNMLFAVEFHHNKYLLVT